jgi:hypothetical protein
VVCLISKQTVSVYSGILQIWPPRSASYQKMGYASGHMIEGYPNQILTAGHTLWDMQPNEAAAGGGYREMYSTTILAIPLQNYAMLSPGQKMDFQALQVAGGQIVFAFQTLWPRLDELLGLFPFTEDVRHLDLALLHLPRCFRSGAPGPHLGLLPVPITIHQNPQDMRAVAIGHALSTANANAPLEIIPRFAAIDISFDFRTFAWGLFGHPSASLVGFSGGPLCVPPEATFARRGDPVGEHDWPFKPILHVECI